MTPLISCNSNTLNLHFKISDALSRKLYTSTFWCYPVSNQQRTQLRCYLKDNTALTLIKPGGKIHVALPTDWINVHIQSHLPWLQLWNKLYFPDCKVSRGCQGLDGIPSCTFSYKNEMQVYDIIAIEKVKGILIIEE